jgi:histidyl-tRNA synthetase
VFYQRIGLTDLSLHVNSIGDQACRPRYILELVRYLMERREGLAPLDRERLERNPLRVLDSKEPYSQSVIEGAPHIEAFLCDECRAHWQKLLGGLDVLGIAYEIDHRLVRGLDYYTRTAFEFMPQNMGAQSVVGAGGRYDALSEAMGGPPLPGVGFGSGIERLVLNMREQGVAVPEPARPWVAIVHAGAGSEEAAMRLASSLRKSRVPATMTFGQRSLKAQLRHANSVGARFAAILGEDELRDGTVTLRDLLEGRQTVIGFEEIVEAIQTVLGSER